MRDFIDKTSEQSGTPINRSNLMAIQGFDTATTVMSYDDDGHLQIVEKNGLNQTKTTVFNGVRSATETFVGDKIITKTTQISNGVISEVIV